MPYFNVGLRFKLFTFHYQKRHLSNISTVVFLNNKTVVRKQYENSRWSIEQTCLLLWDYTTFIDSALKLVLSIYVISREELWMQDDAEYLKYHNIQICRILNCNGGFVTIFFSSYLFVMKHLSNTLTYKSLQILLYQHRFKLFHIYLIFSIILFILLASAYNLHNIYYLQYLLSHQNKLDI